MADRANRARELGPGVGSAARNTDNAYFVDNADGTFDQTEAARVYIKVGGVWKAWDGSVTGGAGGGGAATIADGADVAQGATTDLASASTIVGILKAIKAAITGTVAVSGTFWQSTQPVSIASMPSTPVTGPLTDTQLRATPVPVSGTVATGALTDAQLRATPVPVSGTVTATTGGLTDTQLRASAVPVSLAALPALAAGSAVIGHVIVDTAPSTPVTGPLTDTQLRATPVPVSGTVTATTGDLTDTQLRATPVPVSGTVTASGPLTDTQLRATVVPVSATIATDSVGLAKDASLTTIFGSPVVDGPAAYTVLDQITKLRKASEAQLKVLQQLVSLSTPAAPKKVQLTLLHRSL